MGAPRLKVHPAKVRPIRSRRLAACMSLPKWEPGEWPPHFSAHSFETTQLFHPIMHAMMFDDVRQCKLSALCRGAACTISLPCIMFACAAGWLLHLAYKRRKRDLVPAATAHHFAAYGRWARPCQQPRGAWNAGRAPAK